MTDLSSMSDDDLLRLYQQEKAKTSGLNAVTANPQYQKTAANLRAKSDQARMDAATGFEQAAYDNEQTANRAKEVINAGTPTGLFADQRIAMGKALKGTPLSGHFGIPSYEQTANLETLKSLGNQGALGQVGQLKGPLSDRDVAFLKSLQYDPGATQEQNRRVTEAHQWVAKRQAGYSAALRTWADTLGSPSATNARGETFDRWWGGWSAEHLPPPGIAGPRPQVSRAQAPTRPQNAFAPRQSSGGVRTYNPKTGALE